MCVLPPSACACTHTNTCTHTRAHTHTPTRTHAHTHTQDRGQIAEWLPLAFGLHQTSVKAAGGHFPATGGEVRFISWPQCSRSPESHPVGRAPPAGSPGEERIWCASMLGAAGASEAQRPHVEAPSAGRAPFRLTSPSAGVRRRRQRWPLHTARWPPGRSACVCVGFVFSASPCCIQTLRAFLSF